MAKFITNNNILIFIKLFSFFIIKGLYPYISLDIVQLFNFNICKWILKQKALDIFENIQTI